MRATDGAAVARLLVQLSGGECAGGGAGVDTLIDGARRRGMGCLRTLQQAVRCAASEKRYDDAEKAAGKLREAVAAGGDRSSAEMLELVAEAHTDLAKELAAAIPSAEADCGLEACAAGMEEDVRMLARLRRLGNEVDAKRGAGLHAVLAEATKAFVARLSALEEGTSKGSLIDARKVLAAIVRVSEAARGTAAAGIGVSTAVEGARTRVRERERVEREWRQNFILWLGVVLVPVVLCNLLLGWSSLLP